MKHTRKNKRTRRKRRTYTRRKMRGGISTKLEESEINTLLNEYLVCTYVNVDATKITKISPNDWEIGATYIFYESGETESGEGVLVSITMNEDKLGYTIVYFDTLFSQFVEKKDVYSPARKMHNPVPECVVKNKCETDNLIYTYILYDVSNNPYYQINWTDIDRGGKIYDKDNNEIQIDLTQINTYYRVETEYSQPQNQNKLDVFIEELPFLLRIITLTFIELMRIDVENANTSDLLESFSDKKNAFVTRGINHIQFPPIKMGKTDGKDGTSTLSIVENNPLSIVINRICKSTYKDIMYDTSQEFNADYLEVEKCLNERITKFLSSTSTDKKFGTMSNIASQYKKIIIVLNDIITTRKNTSTLSSITNTLTNLALKPQKVKMYKYASDYLRSQYCKYLNKIIVKNNNIAKVFTYACLFIVIFQLFITCTVSLIQQNYADTACNIYFIILATLSTITLSIKTDPNINIPDNGIIPTKSNILEALTSIVKVFPFVKNKEETDIINTVKTMVEDVSKKLDDKNTIVELSNSARKTLLKTHDEKSMYGNRIAQAFISLVSKDNYNYNYKVIFTAFSHAFYNCINPTLSKRPLIILFSETARRM